MILLSEKHFQEQKADVNIALESLVSICLLRELAKLTLQKLLN